jgi:hypothetical protein
MAQPITWRNVAAPDATAAIKGMSYANETLNSAFTKAGATVGVMTGRVAQDHADAKDTNTRSIMQALQGITTMEQYKAAIESGDFNPDVLQQRFGKDLDFDAVAKAVLQRDNDIMTQEMQDYNYKALQTERTEKPEIDRLNQMMLGLDLSKPESMKEMDAAIKASALSDSSKTGLFSRFQTESRGDEGYVREQTDFKNKQTLFGQSQTDRNKRLDEEKTLAELAKLSLTAAGDNVNSIAAQDRISAGFLEKHPEMAGLFSGFDGQNGLVTTDITKLKPEELLQIPLVAGRKEQLIRAGAAPDKAIEQALAYAQKDLLPMQTKALQEYQTEVAASPEIKAQLTADTLAKRMTALAGKNLTPAAASLIKASAASIDTDTAAQLIALPAPLQREYTKEASVVASDVAAKKKTADEYYQSQKAEMAARVAKLPETRDNPVGDAWLEIGKQVETDFPEQLHESQVLNPFVFTANTLVNATGGYDPKTMSGSEAYQAGAALTAGKFTYTPPKGPAIDVPYDGWAVKQAWADATRGVNNKWGVRDKHVNFEVFKEALDRHQLEYMKGEEDRQGLIELDADYKNAVAGIEANGLKETQKVLNRFVQRRNVGK